MVVSPLALTEPMTTVRFSSAGVAGFPVTVFVQEVEANDMVISVKAIARKRMGFFMINIFESFQ